MVRWLALVIVTWCGFAAAQEGASPGDAVADPLVVLMQNLPEETIQKMRNQPVRFIETAAELIYGFGGEAGLDPAGIERFIALKRSAARAGAVEQLLTADLNDDASIELAEIEALAATLAARRRGTLLLALARADADGDQRVSWPELRAHAQGVAKDEVSDRTAEVLRRFMLLDLSGNGFVTLEEVRQAALALQAET